MKLTERHEWILIALIALHSLIIGVVFILAPNWTMKFGGWEHIEPVFFGRQAGAFHIVLAAGYIVEFARYRGISLILIAKSFAFLFLLVYTILDPLPWAVPTSGVLDGLMALAVWWVHRRAQHMAAEEAKELGSRVQHLE
jgi:hypothetical protein